MQIVKGIDVLGGVEQEPNIYVIDGELIVDTGTGTFFKEIKGEIEGKYEWYKIKSIVNTHCHFDHTGANKKFRDWLKASIGIHINDKLSVETGEHTLSEMFSGVPRVVTIDRVLREGSVIRTTNFSFQVIHTPGHTPGSICLYEPNKKALISGDTLFENGIGRFDLPGGSKDAMLSSLNRLLECNIQYLFPGHGPPKIGGINFFLKQMIAQFGNKRFINYDYY